MTKIYAFTDNRIKIKPINWLGNSKQTIREFPEAEKRITGKQLLRVQKNMKKSSISRSKNKTKTRTSSNIQASSGNVFKDLGFSDAESANLTARCDLLIVLQDIIKKNGWSQSEAAKYLKVGQPRIAEIMHSQSKLFSVDLLIKYLARLGVQVNFKFSKLDWK